MNETNDKPLAICKMKSAHMIQMNANQHVRIAGLVAYPGWRWRYDNGIYYHEQIPNRLLRLWDRLTRRMGGGANVR